MTRHKHLRSCGSATCRLVALILLLVSFLLSACSGSDTPVQFSDDLSIVGSPTVSADFIDQVLANHHSPAIGTGQAFYDLGVKSGIDPVIALGFFQHESSFGTKGEARVSPSIGNIRCIPDYPCRHNFAQFPDWESSIASWYTLVSGPLYVGSGLTTLRQVIHRYAPSADSNDEGAYVQSVAQSVRSWRSGIDH